MFPWVIPWVRCLWWREVYSDSDLALLFYDCLTGLPNLCVSVFLHLATPQLSNHLRSIFMAIFQILFVRSFLIPPFLVFFFSLVRSLVSLKLDLTRAYVNVCARLSLTKEICLFFSLSFSFHCFSRSSHAFFKQQWL